MIAASAAATEVATPAAKVALGDPLIGTEVIGQYVIRSKIGKGGMGTVYLADQKSVGRRAVIKVLHGNLSRDPEIQSRFETEARAASQLNHPNIVTIYNYGAMTDGTLFLAMEHLDGKTLAEVADGRTLPVPRVAHVVGQIASALGEAHRRGVVHRDVKPTNVMLVERDAREDFVKVLDFGIAHVDGTRVTATGDICGTPTYMSPEQIRGKDIDGRSDLYSLGCMLFELLTGEVPFEAGNAIGLAYKHTHEEPPRPSSIARKAKIPPALDAFVARALAKDPADRPRDAAAFRDELRAACEPVPVDQAPATPIAPVQPAPAVVKPAAAKEVAEPAPPLVTRSTRPRARKDDKPKRKRRDTGLFRRIGAALRAPFRRRRSFAERMATRVRLFGGRKRRHKRWPWVIAVGVLAVSVGIGWYLLARPKEQTALAQPTKTRAVPAAAHPATQTHPVTKPSSRTKRGSNTR